VLIVLLTLCLVSLVGVFVLLLVFTGEGRRGGSPFFSSFFGEPATLQIRPTKMVLWLLLLALLAPAQGLVATSPASRAMSTRLAAATGTFPQGFASQREYLAYLESISALPAGFSVGAARFSFKPFEVDKTLPMNLTLIMTEKPTDAFAAMFTSNKFPGGPIIVGRERIKSSPLLQAVVVNNKISNVCPGGSSDFGASDSDQVCQAVADQMGLPSKTLVFPSSTGIIGWKLPVAAIKGGVPVAAASLQSKSIYPAALGITTTDRYPKVRTETSKSKKWSVVGIAKGAGMIGECESVSLWPPRGTTLLFAF